MSSAVLMAAAGAAVYYLTLRLWQRQTIPPASNGPPPPQPGSRPPRPSVIRIHSGDLASDSPPYNPTLYDIHHTAFLLRQRLPGDLVPLVLDHASYWQTIPLAVNTNRVLISESEAGRTYLAGTLPPYIAPRSVRRVSYTIVSRDQGFSHDPPNHGTYEQSYTWFEAFVLAPNEDELTGQASVRYRKRIIYNVHAGRQYKSHTVRWTRDDEEGDVTEVLREVKGGYHLGVTIHAQFPAWVNHVKMGRIEVEVAVVRRMS